MDWKFVFIGLALLGLSAFAQAAYNPYINNGYGRPYYTQFYSLPGVSRVGQIYYGTNVYQYGYSNGYESYSETAIQNPGYVVPGVVYTGYSPYYYYRSPAAFVAPTVTVYTPPVIPVYRVVNTATVVYPQPTSVVESAKDFGYRFGMGFKVLFAG